MRPLARVASLVGATTVMLTAAVAGSADLTPTQRSALERGDCNLCHQVPGIESPGRQASCTECHVWIRGTASDPAKRAKAMAVFPHWERYEKNVASYLEVPSLDAAMARLEPKWVETWLADPHDIRPNLPEGMPTFALSDAERRAIAEAFRARTAKVPKTPEPDPGNVDAGRSRFIALGCPTCHTFGAAVPAAPGTPTAPDLAHTRSRMSPDIVAAWIDDPKQVSPRSTMPDFGVSPEDAVRIRDFLFLADPGWTEPAAVGPPPTPVTAPVSWAEVEGRVFGKICAHCHMDPELPQNQGRPGPGNGGGFGYAPTGIALQSPSDICAVGDRVKSALLARREEARRDTVQPGKRPIDLTRAAKPGMPLGLPPLPDADIALVLGWIEQGCPD